MKLLAIAAVAIIATASVHAQTRPDALLAVDQNRAMLIDRIMTDTDAAVVRAEGAD